MGRGDKKTRKGKIAIGSFGKSRPHHVKAKTVVPSVKEEKPTEPVNKK
jgi:30S ribosomal protein S31